MHYVIIFILGKGSNNIFIFSSFVHVSCYSHKTAGEYNFNHVQFAH